MPTKYREIYSSLLTMIEDNKVTPGELLPSENELMTRFNASRDTVRKSLLLLRENGYIQKNQGKGSIILDHKRMDFPVSGLTSFKELIPTMGKNVKTIVTCLEKMKADPSNQKRLHLSADDDIWYIERVRNVDGESIILDTDILNAQLIPGLTEEIVCDSLYSYIENVLHLKIGFARKEITVQETSNNDLALLDMKNWNSIVSVKSYSYLDNAVLFQYTESRHRPDKFRFVDFARRNHSV